MATASRIARAPVNAERRGAPEEVRLASVNCGAATWQQNFSYDAFGNIAKSVPQGGTGDSFAATYSTATNQMTSIAGQTPSYDANGNVTNDFLHTYAWDVWGRPITIDGISVTYDALGRTVEQNHSGAYTQFVYSPTGLKMQIMSGQSYLTDFVPLPGGGMKVYTPSVSYYRHPDWLGSSRFASTPSRTMYYDGAYAPFGETYAASGTTDVNFTGMNSDVTPKLYDFPAREYGIQGRWPSPDPAGLAAADPSNPQSWNRYSYVLNNPLALTDSSGLCPSGAACYPAGYRPGGWTAGGHPGETSWNLNNASSWDEFDLLNVPVTALGSSGYGWMLGFSAGPSGTMSSNGMSYGFTSLIGGWTWGALPGVVLGNGLDLFDATGQGDQVGIDLWHSTAQCPSCGHAFTNAAGFVNAATTYTVAMSTAVVTTAAVSSLTVANVAVGEFAGNLHLAVGVGGQWIHGVGPGAVIMTGYFADDFMASEPVVFPFLVRNGQAVLSTAGAQVTNCFTGVCQALWNGWVH